MTTGPWLGLVPADPACDARHLEHAVLDVLEALDLTADLVLTHVVRGEHGPRVAASARLTGRGDDVLDEVPLLRALAAAWTGPVLLAGEPDGPSLEAGQPEGRQAARQAVEQGRSGREGRAIRFPGQSSLTGPLPVADVGLVSAITAVLPAVGELAQDAVLDPCGHLRPTLVDGRLVLAVRQGPHGTVVPVEKLDEHACAGH